MTMKEEIKKLNTDIMLLKDECTNELNEVNYFYWPIIAKLKKERKNRIWYVTMTCCLLFVAIVWILFFEIVNEYWIAIALSVPGILIAVTLLKLIITLKAYKNDNEKWQKALAIPKQKQNDLLTMCDRSANMMLSEINESKDELIKKIGTSYDDILEYYNNWVESN